MTGKAPWADLVPSNADSYTEDGVYTTEEGDEIDVVWNTDSSENKGGSPIPGMVFFHPDYTGNISFTTNKDAVVQTRMMYKPYGEVFAQTDGNWDKQGVNNFRYKYNSQQLDDTGLMYFKARYYDPAVGRFITADPTIPNPEKSQLFNRYMFVAGSPVQLMDTSGFEPDNTSGGDSGGNNTSSSPTGGKCDFSSSGSVIKSVGVTICSGMSAVGKFVGNAIGANGKAGNSQGIMSGEDAKDKLNSQSNENGFSRFWRESGEKINNYYSNKGFNTNNDLGRKEFLNKQEGVADNVIARPDVQANYGGYPTWCNKAARLMMEGLGFDIGDKLANGYAKDFKEQSTLSNSNVAEVGAADAQSLANEGYAVLATYYNPNLNQDGTQKSGHIGVLLRDTNVYVESNGPRIVQAGSAVGKMYTRTGFHTPFGENKVKYFVIGR